MGAVVGLSTGLTTNKQSSNEYPESVPLTAACRFCFGSDEVPSGLDYSIASITPGKTCRRLYNDMQNLTNSEDNCTRAQALTALRCGCLQFPPTPTIQRALFIARGAFQVHLIPDFLQTTFWERIDGCKLLGKTLNLMSAMICGFDTTSGDVFLKFTMTTSVSQT